MKFWRALERLPDGAVMLEWEHELGEEFEIARPFLLMSQELARTYPCTNSAGCGIPHRVEGHAGIAVCELDEWCAPIRVESRDLLVFTVDTPKLCSGIADALRLGRPVGRNGTGARADWVGTCGGANSSVFLMCPGDSTRMAREVERLFCAHPDPFVLFTPTGIHCSREVESALKRQSCLHIPLAWALALNGADGLTVRNSIQPLLDQFTRGLAEGKGLVKTVERMDRNLELVAKDKFELRTAVSKLERMRAQGMFAFVEKIDPETLQQFLMIIAAGNVAKASRELGMSDSTLRSKVEGWHQRGKRYAALAEFVRWRKSIKGQAGMERAMEIASGAERDVDYPSLLRDILGELAEFNEQNWEERAEELAQLLKSLLS